MKRCEKCGYSGVDAPCARCGSAIMRRGSSEYGAATGSAIRPDDGNWRMLSRREREYLENTENEAKRAGQLGINCEWLIARLDEIHDALCPAHIGTWQGRAQKAVETAKAVKHNAPRQGCEAYPARGCSTIGGTK